MTSALSKVGMIFPPATPAELLVPAPGWLDLLNHFYLEAGLPLVRLERLTGPEMPEPYRALLVHSQDMTPTLETYYGQTLELQLLARETKHQVYLREVTLHLKSDQRPVEYGVIRISLERFASRTQRMILEETEPLGSILRRERIAHIGWPQAFFRVESNARLNAVLGLDQPQWLHGRRNLLLNGYRQILAEVIEVLAPADLPIRKPY